MRHRDARPAWVIRQRSRLLGRRSDEKIVRWINHHATKAPPTEVRTEAASASSNDNAVAAASARAVKAY